MLEPQRSDPGHPLTRAVIDAGHPVIPVPGPCAMVAAASASGLPTDRLYFVGFLPGRPGRRRRALVEALALPATTVIYVGPHKLASTLELLVEIAGPERPASICRELTKVYEEFLRAPLGELVELARSKKIKGEVTLLVAKAD